MNEWLNSSREMRKQTRAEGTSDSSLTSGSSISAAVSQSILSLLAASLGSTPVSVAFAYKDFRLFFFGASTYIFSKHSKRENSVREPGMKISDISVDISPIYPISVMFDTISVFDRYIVEISGLWHIDTLV